MKLARSDQDEAAYKAWPAEEHDIKMVRSDQDEAAYRAWPAEEHDRRSNT